MRYLNNDQYNDNNSVKSLANKDSFLNYTNSSVNENIYTYYIYICEI